MRVLLLRKTSGLLYDDRLRKTANSLRNLGYTVNIVALEYENNYQRYTNKNDIQVTTISLFSRKLFIRTRGLPFKLIEFYLRIMFSIFKNKPDIVWIYNLQLIGLIPVLKFLRVIGYINKIIWDQLELPPDNLVENKVFLFGLQLFMNWCDHIIMANEERRDYLISKVNLKIKPPISVLLNYPDSKFYEYNCEELDEETKHWLSGKDYLLAQGGANPKRNLIELVDAAMLQKQVKLIVVGPYLSDQVKFLNEKYGLSLSKIVRFSGFVSQFGLIPFIDHAIASVIFYQPTTKNNLYCAPNRLYQAIARGTPVITSQNPPLIHMVEKYKIGISVNANDPLSVLCGVQTIISEYDKFKDNLFFNRKKFLWEEQIDVIDKIL